MSAHRDTATSPVAGSAADVTPTAQLIAEAFADLDVNQWLVPDPATRVRITARYFRIHVEHALTAGAVDVLHGPAGEVAAAAVWFRPDAEEPVDYLPRLKATVGVWLPHFEALEGAMGGAHPGGVHYLAFMAVRPSWQSTGLGSALLEHRHEILDREGQQAYLHAASPAGARLYARHGYQHDGAPFGIPGGPDPAMWPMHRPRQ